MGSEKDYNDRILLKLRRKYSKDEVVSALNKKISDIQIEKGILLDQIDELKQKIENQKKTIINHTTKSKHAKYKKLFEERKKLSDFQASKIIMLQREIEQLKSNQ